MTLIASAGAPTTPEIILVPHTHWDREWYEPFDVFRLRLVHVLDQVVDIALGDPAFRFTLDGQSAAAVDYLEMRPERRDAFLDLARAGRIAIGPWYILLDEFLCSGETIIRNLELGWRTAEELGVPMLVGYLPDMFGHTAQMPQILNRFGIEHAAGWRGVPAAVASHAFRWRAPDGSAVRFENLFDGYASALDLFAIAGTFSLLAADYRSRTRSWYGTDPVLGLVGSDHTSPRPDLMDLVRRHNAAHPELPVAVATLWEYVSRFDVTSSDLAEHEGELRSHARGNILPGVLSIRPGIKAAMADAELMVAQAERLAALWSLEDHHVFLELAWRRIIESSAHDSVTGCGVDDTADQVEARLAAARHAARAVRDRVLETLAEDVPADALVVANTLPYPRTVQVVTEVALREPTDQVCAVDPEGAGLEVQRLEDLESVLGDEVIASSDLHRILHRIHGRELFGQLIESHRWAERQLSFVVAETPEGDTFDGSVLRAEIESASQQPGPWHVTTTARPRRRVAVEVALPPLGHTTVRLGTGVRRREPSDDDVSAGLGLGGLAALHSPLVDVTLRPDGTLRVIGVDGAVLDSVCRLVDEGDRGDSYNYGQCARGTVVDTPRPISEPDVQVLYAGPRRATIRYARTYDIPVGLGTDPDERDPQTAELTVTSEVELRAGEPFVRITTSFLNTVPDHRLRLHVGTGATGSPSWSWASSAFTVTRRGRTAEAGWGEFPLPTFPAETFVSAASATVLTDRITEFELVDRDGSADLAITLLRAVGLMSVNVHPLRDEPAGAQLPVPGAQYLGRRVTTRLAVLPGAGSPNWSDVKAPRWAEVFRHGGLARRGLGPISGPLRPAASGPRLGGVDGLLTSLRPIAGGNVEARFVALSDEPTVISFDLGDAAQRTDLRGRRTDKAVRSGVLELGPWEIGTLRAPRRAV